MKLATYGLIGLFALRATGAQDVAHKSEVAAIETYCARINEMMTKNPKPPRIFADISDGYAKGPEKWREFRTEEERQKADSGSNLNQTALVGFKSTNVIAASFTLQSASRDWAHFITYCFRADGSLAKIDAQLNTFYGHLSVFRERFYTAQGKLLESREKFKALSSQKEAKPSDDFIDEPIPVYITIRDLPFYKLL